MERRCKHGSTVCKCQKCRRSARRLLIAAERVVVAAAEAACECLGDQSREQYERHKALVAAVDAMRATREKIA